MYALLADRRLLAVSPATASVAGEVRLPGTADDAPAHVVAFDPRGRLLFVLLRDVVAAVDARTLAVRATWTLPAGVQYRTIAVGPAGGDVFAFGDRDEDGGRSPWLTRLDASGAVKGTWRLRRSEARTWTPYAAAVAADEGYAVVSYHGPDTTGADIVRLDDPARPGCAASGSGCIAEIHGTVEVSNDRVWGTTGDGAVIVSVDPAGLERRRFDPGLPGNHLMEFAVDPAGPVYALGSCLYSGGLSRLDPGAETAKVLAPPATLPQRPGLCGERIAAGPAALVAIARGPSLGRPRPPVGLIFVEGTTGHVRATVPTPVTPVDVVVG